MVLFFLSRTFKCGVVTESENSSKAIHATGSRIDTKNMSVATKHVEHGKTNCYTHIDKNKTLDGNEL